ncbi:MAG: polyprenyl synthetase family protein [Thermodesulfobacteriota bacterium]|nr:polyprenyl synthetase family protein [Thermodesulfobacteriota bacterium]
MNKNKKNRSFRLSDYLKEKRDLINEHLEIILKKCVLDRELTKAMRHSLMAEGKRIRPVLAMAAAEIVSKNCGSTALPCACAIEMIHTYSLIHDDLPAMDNDDLRRGKPTCHRAFSEATAILAGDALLTHGFYVLAKPELFFKQFPDKAVLLDLVGIISDASGANGMIEGQMMDMLSSSNSASSYSASSYSAPSDNGPSDFTPAPPLVESPASSGQSSGQSSIQSSIQSSGSSLNFSSNQANQGSGSRELEFKLNYLKKIHKLKTGRMIMASLKAGAVSAGADKKMLDNLAVYAEKIGLAFQVTDDILNVEGDPAVMGKSSGSDAINDKMTFPALLGMDESKKYAKKLVNDSINALKMFDEQRALPLKFIAEYIVTRSR